MIKSSNWHHVPFLVAVPTVYEYIVTQSDQVTVNNISLRLHGPLCKSYDELPEAAI